MRTRASWLCFGALLAASACRAPEPESGASAGPVEWRASATADKDEVQVGEALEVELRIVHPAGADFAVGTGDDLQPFELIERRDEPSASPAESRIRLRLGAYRLPGDIAVPAIRVAYRDDTGQIASIETDPIPIRLVTSLTPDVTDIHDIKDPLELALPFRRDRLGWLLLALAAALLAYFLYRRLARRRAPSLAVGPPTPPPLPPDEEAERALRELAAARLLERGAVREHYDALSEILKRYAGRRFAVPYLERTTAEIARDLDGKPLAESELRRLRRILDTADLVKFARVIPPEELSQEMLPEAFRFVGATRPAREAAFASGAGAAVGAR